MLAALRAAGCDVEDLEIGRADLEDVFLEIMAGEQTPHGGGGMIASRHSAGTRTLLYKEVLRFWKVASRPSPRRC